METGGTGFGISGVETDAAGVDSGSGSRDCLEAATELVEFDFLGSGLRLFS